MLIISKWALVHDSGTQRRISEAQCQRSKSRPHIFQTSTASAITSKYPGLCTSSRSPLLTAPFFFGVKSPRGVVKPALIFLIASKVACSLVLSAPPAGLPTALFGVDKGGGECADAARNCADERGEGCRYGGKIEPGVAWGEAWGDEVGSANSRMTWEPRRDSYKLEFWCASRCEGVGGAGIVDASLALGGA